MPPAHPARYVFSRTPPGPLAAYCILSDPAMSRHHAIDYVELSVLDLAAAKAFYADAFGWAFTDYGPTYAGIRGPEREVGGMEQTDAVTTGGPLVILYSDDLAASLAAVEAAGGTISTPPFDFPGGRRFHFRDPSGNELAIWAEADA